MISPGARRSIDLTHGSVSHEVTDHYPIVKRPDEVINLVTLDLVLLTYVSGPAGVWYGVACLISGRSSVK